MIEPDALLRELHHRVKNNFQIIASLVNLQKRLLPEDRRADLRFIEEHVQSMAVAYRVVWASQDFVSVSIADLIAEVMDGLKHVGGCAKAPMTLDLPAEPSAIGLNQAIALSLYLAVIAPPMLDRVMASEGTSVQISLRHDGDALRLILSGTWDAPLELDFLRTRLAEAYVRQLNGEQLTELPPSASGVRFVLGPLTIGEAS